MLKIIFFILLITGADISLNAQTLSSTSGDHYQETKREVFDQAKLCIPYQLQFRKDSTKVNEYTKAQTVLMVSDDYLFFVDYNRVKLDSINNYLAESKKNRRNEKARNEWQHYIDLGKFYWLSLSNIKTRQTTVQCSSVLNSYEYSYPTPEIKWNLVKGDSIVNGTACKKATCTFSGRNYVAWYAESIPLPFGPYLFGGLPGLILEIHDVNHNWIFTNNGMGKATEHKDMYLYKKRIIGKINKTTRENALEGYRNDVENFENLFVEKANVKVMKDGKWVSRTANYPKRPSNMLELVW